MVENANVESFIAYSSIPAKKQIDSKGSRNGLKKF